MKVSLIALTLFISANGFAYEASSSSVEKKSDDVVLFSCETEELNDVAYRYAIELKETSVSVFQSSTIARYRPLVNAVERLEIIPVHPEGQPLFSCVSISDSDDSNTVSLSVYDDLVVVSESTTFAPVYFSKLAN
ncbi:MAG: hypothetical protein EOP04_06360 [Proteobacteria bacterium]|nr:MAG: hypothetical protein EOP04_06360 [Pseudomonadota bacterium]